MPIELPILDEIHTSDLTGSCMRATAHRLLGESLTVVPTAMARGLIAGATLEICHNKCITEPDFAVEACKDGLLNVRDSLSSEGRQFSDSVEANLEQIVLDVISMAGHYVERFGGRLVCCEKLGAEVPIRMTVEHPLFDEPVEFASHLDAIFRDTEGEGRTNRAVPAQEYATGDVRPGMSQGSNLQERADGYMGDALRAASRSLGPPAPPVPIQTKDRYEVW